MIKRSIYFGHPIEVLLEGRVTDTAPATTLINTVVDRYLEIVRRERPRLTTTEWMVVFDALKGTITWNAQALAATWAGIADAIRLEGLADKWGVNGPRLIDTLRDLDYCQSVALVDTAERFWAMPTQARENPLSALAALGVRPEPELDDPPIGDPDYTWMGEE